jgi:REP element-mobilizing transposase RayT
MSHPDFYRRRLPHWHPEGQTFFITFRLANSFPDQVIQALQEERERERRIIRAQFSGNQQRQELYNLDKKYFGRFDAWLDRCIAESPRWLAQENVARIVAEQIHALDGERCRLIAYCIMFNHGHLLIDTADYQPPVTPPHAGPTAPYPLADTLKLLKGRTARYCNQALGRSGAFWHHESYDHVVRDEKEFERIIWYILNNPVKAGLVKNWEDWPFTYCAE